jgi:hypothetical protein
MIKYWPGQMPDPTRIQPAAMRIDFSRPSAYYFNMRIMDPLQIGELCRRLDVPYRDARYVLERGHLPAGVEVAPGHGHHRQLTASQAAWLALILKLKVSGLRVPEAVQVADFAREAVRTVGQQMGWDPAFAPFDGRLETINQWYIDIGDMKSIRLVTDACPSEKGLHQFDWTSLERPRRPSQLGAPAVILRLDLTRIAQLLLA